MKAVTRFLNLCADTSATNQNRCILHHYFWYLWFSLDKRQLILPLFILWCNWRLFYTPKKSIMTQREWNTTGMFYGCLLCVVELWAFFHTGSGVLGFAHRISSWTKFHLRTIFRNTKKKHGCRGKARIFQAHTDAIVHIQCFVISRSNALMRGLTY